MGRRNAVLIVVGIAFAGFVVLGFAKPRTVPRLGIFPAPAAEHYWDGCSWHTVTFSRSGPVWGSEDAYHPVACVKTQSTTNAPQLSDDVLRFLHDRAAKDALGHATSADWVLTTYGQAATITSGAGPEDNAPVYLFDVRGNFRWDHSCPPPGVGCVSVGTHEVFTLDPATLQVLDFGVQQQAPDLAQLGPVGHIQL
jgi:hypothetical protein